MRWCVKGLLVVVVVDDEDVWPEEERDYAMLCSVEGKRVLGLRERREDFA